MIDLTPQEAEHALVAEAILDARGEHAVIARCRALVSPEDFGDPKAEAVWRAMLAIVDRGERVDFATLGRELRRLNTWHAAGPQFVSELCLRFKSRVEHCEDHARIVRDASLRRALASVMRGGIDVVMGAHSAEEAIARIRSEVDRIGERVVVDEGDLTFAAVELFADMEAAAEGRVRGAQTGIASVDAAIGGAFAGDMVVVAADQSRGKTAFALQWARHVAESGDAALIFSYEMPRKRVLHRLAQQRCGLGEQRVRAGQLSAFEMNAYGRATTEAAQLPVMVFEQLPVEQIGAKVRAIAARRRVGLVVVDYLQILTPSERIDDRATDYARITRHSRELKRIAMTAGVPVVVVSQFNRGGNKAAEPTMHDLRGSGAIESDADTILLLHAESEDTNDRVLLVPKNRAGERFHRLPLRWDGPRQSLRDGDAEEHPRDTRAHLEVDDADDAPPWGTFAPGGDAE